MATMTQAEKARQAHDIKTLRGIIARQGFEFVVAELGAFAKERWDDAAEESSEADRWNMIADLADAFENDLGSIE
jgi:hypothetical protein